MKLMRLRGQSLARVTNTFTQHNLAAPEKRLSSKVNRIGIAERFSDVSVQQAVRSDLALAEHLDDQLRGVESYLVAHAKIDDPQTFARLQTVRGSVRSWRCSMRSTTSADSLPSSSSCRTAGW